MLSIFQFKRQTSKVFRKLKSKRNGYRLLKNVKDQDIPKVPIKTYRWEDVRRSRRRGAYPWTHLTKPPFDEELDPEEYTMDAFRRSRSTSTIGKSETQEVSEVEEDIEMKDEAEQQKETNGFPEEKENIEPSEIEQPGTSKPTIKTVQSTLSPNTNGGRSRSEEPGKKRKLSLESSASKISLSKQALMDKLKDAKNKLKVPKLPKRSKSDISDKKEPKKQKTASTKSTETTKSSWLPPLPSESPVYIHIPLKLPPGETDEFSKLEFESPSHSRGGSLTNLSKIEEGKRKMSLLGLLTEIKKVSEHQKLANESRRSSQTSNEALLKQIIKLRPDFGSKKETGGAQSSKDKLKMVDKKEPKSDTDESVDSVSTEPNKLGVGKGRLQRKESDRLVIEEVTEDDRKSNRSTEDSKPESERTHKPRTPEPIVVEPDESSADDNISQYLDKEDKCEIVSEKSANVSSESLPQAGPSKTEEAITEIKSQKTLESDKQDPAKVIKLEATLSKWKKQLPPVSTPQAPAAKPAPIQRAKSEEPKQKRRSSIDSSYSRKSLSKLAFIKKIKEAKDKFKLPKFPSFAKSDKKDTKSKKPKTEKPAQSETVQLSKKQQTKPVVEPVYIHIPLKLPPGQTDEFSHLADQSAEKPTEPVKPKEVKKEEEEESSVPDTPDTPDTPDNHVQLIILTPPSDDEILDSATIPDTPLESDQKFFEGLKIDELKNLAKTAVDTLYPDSHKLETVKEDEDVSDASEGGQEKTKENKDEPDVPEQKKNVQQLQQQMLVDEEDGLKLSDAAIAMINEEMAKELKEQEQELKSNMKSEGSPPLKKKVSFKRRSKAEDGERIYEDVELNAAKSKETGDTKENKEKPNRLESFQSMSVDEEKSYLDKKVIKDTSLEDDYNKWSKSNDHEYEPVNPPPEAMTSKGPPTVAVPNIKQTGSIVDNTTASPERHFVRIPPDDELVVHGEGDVMPEENIDYLGAEEVQRRIEDRYFNATPTTTGSRTDGELNTSQVDSSAIETLPLKKESRRKVAATKSDGICKDFNASLRNKAGKLKAKLQGIKKPNITLPERPKFSTSKFKKPNFKMPKMPERPSISLPSFNKTRKDSSKDSWRERQFSTESNAGDSKKKIFDFRTYPRIFDRSKKNKDAESSPSQDRAPTPPPPEFATVPRVGRKKGPIGSRWANKFKDIKYADEDARKSKEFDDEDTQDVIRIPLHPDNEVPMDVPSHTRYNEDIDIDDDFDRENRDIHRASPFSKDYLRRWNHGEFHEGPLTHDLHNTQFNRDAYRITDLDNDTEEVQTPPSGSFDIGMQHPKEEHSSGSLSEHRQGVLEEIDSDEFFLREKGISQENIEVGKYLSSEIREAFRNPVNALSQLQSEDREYDLDASDQSEPLPDAPRKKPLRKPKRKKTPTTSKEHIGYDRESVTTEPEEYPKRFEEFKRYAPPPARPKRRSKKGKKKKPVSDDVVPYQETIPIEEQFPSFIPDEYALQMMEAEMLPDNILGDDQQKYFEKDFPQMYENEHMKGIEQPEIKVSNPYYRYENFQDINKFMHDEAPIAPTRRQRSLKSLNASEQDSMVEEIPQQNIEAYRAEHEYIIPTPEPPARPKRIRSRTQSQSGEDDRTSRGAESLMSDNQIEVIEVIEEPCIQDIRDASGYAVIDKTKIKDPPLPPSRIPTTPPRTRRRKPKAQSENKFATTPRLSNNGPPMRPLRNYSTLGSSNRTSRSMTPNEEEKENLDLSQYSEIDGEPVRHLISGEVIQKMRDRPLPAPPRPPRKPRGSMREVFRDISHERNLPPETHPSFDKAAFEEVEMSNQTSEFVSDEQPGQGNKATSPDSAVIADIESQIMPFEYEETITHGSLVVQPIDNAQILPHSQIRNIGQRTTGPPPVERTIPVTREYVPDVEPTKQEQTTYDDDEETSEIPDEFKKLKSPQQAPTPTSGVKLQQQPTYQTQGIPDNQEVSVLKAQKLQVIDLDVDKLRVNELQANKIVVSELDGVSLQVSEINSKSGNLVLSGIELPPHLIQEMLDRLQAAAHEHVHSTTEQSISPQSSEATTQTIKLENATEESENTTQVYDESVKNGQKKTPFKEDPLEISNFEQEAPPVPPRYDSKTDLLEENVEENKEIEPEPQEAFTAAPEEECLVPERITESAPQEPPVRPPRKSVQAERTNLEESDTGYLNVLEFENPAEDSTDQPLVQPEFSDSVAPADNTSKSDEELPPRPPQPVMQQESEYIPSQPPASFFALKSPQYGEFVEEDIPLPPRRKRHHRAAPVSRSSSEDTTPAPRRHHRSPEPSIPQLTGQLVRACATESNRSFKRLISHITNNVLQNADGKQDLHVMILMLLILIAGLILLGDENVTIHHHHWEFFNPPRDL